MSGAPKVKRPAHMNLADELFEAKKAAWEAVNGKLDYQLRNMFRQSAIEEAKRIIAARPKTPQEEQLVTNFIENMDIRSTINGIQCGEFVSACHKRLVSNLERYGNVLSLEHEQYLGRMLVAYTRMAQGVLKDKRIAVPLGTGLGKTSSILAWITELHEHGLDHISVAVCASKVEALCQLKLDLIASGVPEEKIGLWHSYKCDPRNPREGYASLPATPMDVETQILLVTHSRVRGKGGIEEFNSFQGKPRTILFWDESLIKSNTNSMTLRNVRSSLASFKILTEANPPKVTEYLDTCMDILTEAVKTKSRDAIRLPELTDMEVEAYKSMIIKNHDILKKFLDFSQLTLRTVPDSQGDGLITYKLVVPDELENIFILDASTPIRKLIEMDKTIQRDDTKEFRASYENVTIHQLKSNSGRNAMELSFRQARREDRKVCQTVAELIKTLPGDEGILIFTFKRHPDSFLDLPTILVNDLYGLGVNLDEEIDGKKRINILTWGNETSLNSFSYCKHVILVGVIQRSEADISAAIVGQLDDINAEVQYPLIQEVKTSEMVHSVYQALSRGSCRIVTDGRASKMDAWVIHPDDNLKEGISTVMRGVKWTPWRSEHLGSKADSGKIGETAKAIEKFLESFDGDRISTRELKKRTGLSKVSKPSFSLAISNFSCTSPTWKLDGRSLVRR